VPLLVLMLSVSVLPSCALFTSGLKPAARDSRDNRMVNDTAKRAQEQIALGNYKQALEIYAHAYDRHHLAGHRQGFLRLGEQIRAVSDKAYQDARYAEAGVTARNLFESGITTRDFADKLSFDDDFLTARISACSRSLMELGLMRYREEKLDEAIAIWRRALDFDTGNKTVRQAIDTATAQLQQLKHIK